MSYHDEEIEDGMGFSGLVPTRAERAQEKRDAYTKGMADYALRLEGLVREIISSHADHESWLYNECHDGELCAWCVDASAALASKPKEPT